MYLTVYQLFVNKKIKQNQPYTFFLFTFISRIQQKETKRFVHY
tara:strand:- start:5112 stop:5240 length:129 start_codon:yes stop_codon:yes gene_type:complete